MEGTGIRAHLRMPFAKRRAARPSRYIGTSTASGSSALITCKRSPSYAAERAGDGVVAFGIGGSEERGPAACGSAMRSPLPKARGLHLHRARWRNRRAGIHLGCPRSRGRAYIGHGIAAAQDPDLMRGELRERDIPLEVCITSNLVTGVVKSIEEHPVRRLFDAGVPITLNTDDPAMFGCTLAGEYALAARTFGFSETELRGIAENGFRYAFKRSWNHQTPNEPRMDADAHR